MKKKILKRGRKVIAKIMWYDKRDGEGIAYEQDGTEFYFDESVIKKGYVPETGDFVVLAENLDIAHVRCGLDVAPLIVSELTRREFSIAGTIRFAKASLASAHRQIIGYRKERLRLKKIGSFK